LYFKSGGKGGRPRKSGGARLTWAGWGGSYRCTSSAGWEMLSTTLPSSLLLTLRRRGEVGLATRPTGVAARPEPSIDRQSRRIVLGP